ncbi:MAG: UvrD-helicase domain-containing protein [Nitrospirota bacterium]
MKEVLEALNPQQQEAARHKDGPLLILAGAGSGKTRVITYRTAYLISEGIEPKNILAVTFTKKAAEEMRKRVEDIIPLNGSRPLISTFHSACVKILRDTLSTLSPLGRGKGEGLIAKGFLIYDKADALSVIKGCAKELNINDELYSADSIAKKISSLKNNLISADNFKAQEFGFEDKVKKVYKLYQEKLSADSALDFDDLLMKTVELFEKNIDVLSHYQDVFKYIMVDEYQDTNYVQYRLIMLLSSKHRNICVVGDDDQSIYGFRGANISNILNFEKDFPDAKIVKLEQNYRSTQKILDAASSVVDKNISRRKKTLWTENQSGEKIRLYKAEDGQKEALYICKTIKEIRTSDNRRYKDFAVLYRINAQSRILEEQFHRMAIPYIIVGGLRFYERKEIKDITAYLRVIANPDDDVSLKRIINTPSRGIGQATIEKLTDLCKERKLSLYEGAKNIGHISHIGPILNGFANLIDSLIEKGGLSLSDLVKEILAKTGYIEWLKSSDKEDAENRIENINEFISAVADFEQNNEKADIQGFLDHISLSAQIDDVSDKDDAVFLMTLHNAKGLEFPVVFVSGMEEGIFPNFRAFDDDRQLEEERRLCYVGITRAKEKLYITHAEKRFIFGSERNARASRFIDEIPEELVEEINEEEKGRWGRPAIYQNSMRPALQAPRQSESKFSDERYRGAKSCVSTFPVGAAVLHPNFGRGRVKASEGTGDDEKVIVNFEGAGLKRLSVKYARLERA